MVVRERERERETKIVKWVKIDVKNKRCESCDVYIISCKIVCYNK